MLITRRTTIWPIQVVSMTNLEFDRNEGLYRSTVAKLAPYQAAGRRAPDPVPI